MGAAPRCVNLHTGGLAVSRSDRHINSMPETDLTDADRAELARILRRSIDADRFPLSPRVQRWKELLAKLDPEPPAAAEPYSPPKAWVNSTIGQRKRRRR